MGGSESGAEEHIVMLPLMAHGHMIPFLGLAKQIQQRTTFKLTLVSTPLNVQYLSSCIIDDSTKPEIRLVALPFNGADHGLPPDTENTEGLPLHNMITLVGSTVALKEPFRNLISDITAEDGKPPLCIISDTFIGWASEVARACGTVNVGFTTSGAYGTACFMSFWRDLPHLSAAGDDGEFTMPAFPPGSCRFDVSHLHPYMRGANGEDSWSMVYQPIVAGSLKSIGWLCNTVKEIEDVGSYALGKFTKLTVWCIGPFLPPAMLNKGSSSGIIGKRTGKDHGLSPEKCIEWLDMHSEGSVLYISFGSQNTISASQMMALALGLEDGGKPFIWAIRPPIGFDMKGEFKSEWLPEGFTERIARRKQGLLIHSWAPQQEILCHKSTAAFLSHCGWNSTLESLSQGVPIIGWPMAGEQAFNSKMMVEEMGVCVELTKGVQSTILKGDVKRVIDIVLDSSKGIEMKKNAVRIGEMIRAAVREDETSKGSSLQAMDDFISTLLSKRIEV